MREASKAEVVRKVLHLSNNEIARLTGFAQPYIRAVRQRTDKNGNPMNSPADQKWLGENYTTEWNTARCLRWRSQNRERYRASQRRYYHARKRADEAQP